MRRSAGLILLVVSLAFGCNDAQRALMSGLKPYRITTTSMEPALKNGEYVFARKYEGTPNPKRGEIVVFRYPLQPGTVFAKRVVAIPGDSVQIVRKQLLVNGRALLEPYVTHADPQTYDNTPGLPEPYKSRDTFGPIKLGSDQFFVLGDNRDRSSDSRYWGAVPRRNLVAKAVSAGRIDEELRPVN